MITTDVATTTATRSPVAWSRKHQTTIHSALTPRITCQPPPHSLDALDLSSAAFASLLLCLADIEASLSQLESPLPEFDLGQAISRGELKIEEVRAWARDGLEILKQIREEHLPEFSLDPASSYVSARIHDLSGASNLKRVASHLPELPRFHRPEHYIFNLSEHLKSLHSHLSSSNALSLPSFPSTVKLSELIDTMLSSDAVTAVLGTRSISRTEDDPLLGRAATEVARAIERSFHGAKLITYSDLPSAWRSNPFIIHGYRFIPIKRWPLIVASMFALHNETLNIHTHLIPLLLWTSNTFLGSSIPFSSTVVIDAPILIFTIFSLFTLFGSVVWHTMAGCAHHRSMVLCAKIDYVGIAWLISCSVGTVIYYGFQCSTITRNAFLLICLLNGLGGSIVSLWDRFDGSENKKWRITYFVSSTTLITVAPLALLSLLHSVQDTIAFIRPVIPSIASYVAGLVFYATRFPECMFPVKSPRLAWLGGVSHTLWHLFIVLAIALHRSALSLLKDGISGSGAADFCPLLV